jgi:hypothetical protein
VQLILQLSRDVMSSPPSRWPNGRRRLGSIDQFQDILFSQTQHGGDLAIDLLIGFMHARITLADELQDAECGQLHTLPVIAARVKGSSRSNAVISDTAASATVSASGEKSFCSPGISGPALS